MATLTVIVGPMRSGKTDELLRLLNLERIARRTVVVVKPACDTRCEGVTARDGRTFARAVSVPSAQAICDAVGNATVVGIEEAQFLDDKIVAVIEELYARGVDIYVTALDTDFLGRPFGSTPRIMAIPEAVIIRRTAVCEHCHNPATRSHRKISGNGTVMIGDEEYEPLCFTCHRIALAESSSHVTITTVAPT